MVTKTKTKTKTKKRVQRRAPLPGLPVLIDRARARLDQAIDGDRAGAAANWAATIAALVQALCELGRIDKERRSRR